MVKRRTPWKEGKVLSIETRKGVFVLAQMLKEPFMRFYNVFRENENWGKVDTGTFKTLFVNAVTGSFLKSSNVSVIEGAIPDFGRENSNKNVDPYKDLVFNREISKDYKIAIEIISGGGDKGSKEKILETYYR